MIYLDNASTTPVHPSLQDEINLYNSTLFYNPSSSHSLGFGVNKKLNEFRQNLLNVLGATNGQIVYTSGATEANNLCIKSGVKSKQSNVVISASEHDSVYAVANILKAQNTDVRIAKLNTDGTVNYSDFISKIDAQTALVSVTHTCGQTGAKNDIKTLCKAAKSVNSKILFHSDGVQALLKTPFSLGDFNIDLYTVSAHKLGAPKGIGAVYIKNGVNLQPILYGGKQENHMRAGTQNVSAIAGFNKAILDNFYSDLKRFYAMQDVFYNAFKGLQNITINGDKENKIPHIISVTLSGQKAEIIQTKLMQKNIAVGIGSACSGNAKDNRVLSAMGLNNTQVAGSIRISLGYQNTVEECKIAAQEIVNICKM